MLVRYLAYAPLLLALGAVGCFNPNYGDQAFRCTTGNKTCPDGYSCRQLPHPSEPGASIFQCVSDGIESVPAISIDLPTPTVAQGETLTLDTSVTNFIFDSTAADGAPVDGRGHAHAYLDRIDATTYLKRVLGPTVGVPIPVDAAVGQHTLIVALAENDHTLVQIGGNNITDTATFTVTQGDTDGGGGGNADAGAPTGDAR